jgi:hypothetical protein
MKGCLNVKIYELATQNKIKISEMCIDALSDYKYGYQTRSNIVKDGKGGLVTYSHSILARWRNHFSELLYVHGVNVRQREIHTSDPLVPEPLMLGTVM